MSAILRHRYPNRFTVLPNDAIRNQALSFRAVGVLAHLLSLPDGAKVDSATLAAAHKEGRDAVRAAYKELEAHGYYRREVLRLADGTLRTEVVVSSTPMKGEAAGRTEAGFSGVGPEPDYPAPVEPAPDKPTSVGPTPVDQAPKEEVPTTKDRENPPTPRRAGGLNVAPDRPTANGRRVAGTNPRARQTNPRAEADLAEAARVEAEVAARQAQLERTNEARRAADLAAQTEADRLEAEALAVSAALDDDQLAAVVALVTERMAGPLARSSLAISRAVVAWCRTAATEHPGPLPTAVTAGLNAGLVAGEGSAAMNLPAAPEGTAPLRHRIAGLRTPTAVV
jgi:hypothetical protein